MRVSFSSFALACAMALSVPAFAQDAGVPAPQDAGSPDTDAGVGPGPGDLAPTCAGTGESTCGTGNICNDGFCYVGCTLGAACTTLLGLSGGCFRYAGAPDQSSGICATAGEQDDLCGGMINASCATTVCLSTAPGGPGFCSVICDPANPSTCLTASLQGFSACGCASTQVCSNNPLALENGDGICAEPNIDGTCGVDVATGSIEVCTNGQQCDATAVNSVGNCVGETQPDPADGGTTTDPVTGDDAGTTDPVDGDDAGSTGTPDDEPGLDEPEPEPTGGCSASHVPSKGLPFGLAGLALLGVFFRRRRS
ncbi:MAG: hypothetical protein GY822_16930 [Deltaproteobacteria bacterium]|nr:hypothetical protein [Deltaproteobacteria bacterium]